MLHKSLSGNGLRKPLPPSPPPYDSAKSSGKKAEKPSFSPPHVTHPGFCRLDVVALNGRGRPAAESRADSGSAVDRCLTTAERFLLPSMFDVQCSMFNARCSFPLPLPLHLLPLPSCLRAFVSESPPEWPTIHRTKPTAQNQLNPLPPARILLCFRHPDDLWPVSL